MSERRHHVLSEIMHAKDLTNPYLLVGVAGRMATRSERDSAFNRHISRLLGRYALQGILAKPSDVVPRATLWHGTGRFKHTDNGPVDVLESMAKTGHILPSYDAFDLKRPMNSISFARSRMYARAYADMHGNGSGERERYGTSLFWACAFLGSVAIEAALETKVWKPSGYHRMVDHLATADTAEWYRKVTRSTSPTVLDVYKEGSDIPDNYPVLIGVRPVEPTEVSRAVALHEVRTEQAVPLDECVTHIEVPEDRLKETKRLLGRYALSIIPIEEGEQHSAQYGFSDHIHGAV